MKCGSCEAMAQGWPRISAGRPQRKRLLIHSVFGFSMRLLLFLLLVSPVFAFPQLLSLDGFLTNSSGSALNGSFSFVFSLYPVPSGGSALWSESQTLTVSSGKLNALLGSVSALNLPFDQDYYLGVKVSADSEMSPRYRIASSAYAYSASYADTAKSLAQNATALGGLRLGDTASACDSSSRGTMKYVAGGSGVADGVFQCMKKSSGNYSWVLIKSSGLSATGGTITEVGGYRIHAFTSSGAFAVSEGGTVEYLIVAGGGAGGAANTASGASGGGGGAGGFRTGAGYNVTAQAYAITVGAGGTGVYDRNGNSGSNSVFDSIIAIGGGGGGTGSGYPPLTGGSGGGGDYIAGAAGTAGQGSSGGTGSGASQYTSGGGGGAGAPGGNGAPSVSGNGGAGLASSISGSSVYYAGGGGGGAYASGRTPGTGGQGGGGTGQSSGGTANTGGGGGAGSGTGYSGGSGIVIIRYPI